jgi:hypothetical protein
VPGRHRHAVDVRSDGLAAVLGRVLHHPGVRSAALVDVDSGMLLDGWVATPGAGPDPEVLGAGHAELVRVALGLLPPALPGDPGGELVLDAGAAGQHVLRVVPDPHGGRLALSVVVIGPQWAVARVRRRLRRVSAAALTAGPSAERRPGDAVWSLRAAAGPVPRRSWWSRPAPSVQAPPAAPPSGRASSDAPPSGQAPPSAPLPGPTGADLFAAPRPAPGGGVAARGRAALGRPPVDGRSALAGPAPGPVAGPSRNPAGVGRPAPARPAAAPSRAADVAGPARPAAGPPPAADAPGPARADPPAGPAMARLGRRDRVLPDAVEAVDRMTGAAPPALPAPRGGAAPDRDPGRPVLVALPGGAGGEPDPGPSDRPAPDLDPEPRDPGRGRPAAARSPAPPSALPPAPPRGPAR